ncbi:hypothetical protein ACN47E_001381 [Coniothyrium glycines]
MNIWVGNLPPRTNHVVLAEHLKSHLSKADILVFDIGKPGDRNWTFVTVPSLTRGQSFLNHYGPRYGQPIEHVKLRGRTLKFNSSKVQPESLLISALQVEEEKLRAKKMVALHDHAGIPKGVQQTLPFTSMMTGVWEFDARGLLAFDPKLRDARSGWVTFGRKALALYLAANSSRKEDSDWHARIDIPYAIVEHVIVSDGGGKQGIVAFTLKSPPKIYEIRRLDDINLYSGKMDDTGIDHITSALATLNLGQSQPLARLTSLNKSRKMNVGISMVYSIALSGSLGVSRAYDCLVKLPAMQVYCCKIRNIHSNSTIEEDYDRVTKHLSNEDLRCYPGFDFSVRYQLMALVLEGTITPTRMLKFVPVVKQIAAKFGAWLTAVGIRRSGQQILTPSPHATASDYSSSQFGASIVESIIDEGSPESIFYSMNQGLPQKKHLVLTYRSIVTPTGMLLRGPDYDISNRVLRKYANYSEYFMRVSFTDEDGTPIHYDGRADQQEIFARFTKVFHEGISVAGRTFSFLGFSHSSLRSHQAWFVAPFPEQGILLEAKDIIADLGDFSHIRCSAKCAARIGQAFTDTIFAVAVPDSSSISQTKDIRRNGRCFSDGCGTISQELLHIVWKHLPRNEKPTTIQIRFQGAKGVLSLDATLKGQQLLTRDSMVKFTTAKDRQDIEICDAANKPLKVYLNHQFIKILEDLGVSCGSFLHLQNAAIEQLKLMTSNPMNVSRFLETTQSAVSAKIPELIAMFGHIGLPFHSDRFLTDIVEVAAMTHIRALKYRARIPVPKGYLLYGIVDEWNVLDEGEVFVTIDDAGQTGYKHRGPLVRNRILVTRAPALHPGDVQLVRAVDVQEGSPLRKLHNCIVFSQRGNRDLPSQLSGGDLDGDKFHIIFDDTLMPKFTVSAAEYPPVQAKDLGRQVQARDIVEHFIDFMKSDQLGPISTKHKIRADKHLEGTHHHECKLLAKLASDAVDFSKSGNAVDMSQIPRGKDSLRPDFMAPSPRLILDESTVELAMSDDEDHHDFDPLSVLNADQPQHHYYRSHKSLGNLYRAINEQTFFADMRKQFELHRQSSGNSNLMQKLEEYIDRETSSIQWKHHKEFAERMCNTYKNIMLDIMHDMRAHRSEPLTELEVVSGNILGKKEHKESRFTREANIELRQRFNYDISGIIMSIIKGEDDWEELTDDEALPRAIACFKIAIHTSNQVRTGRLQSWDYVSAAVCLKELWKYNASTTVGGLRRF